MKRLLAGTFEPHGGSEGSRLHAALAPHTASVLRRGPLHLAFTGEAPANNELLCLLDGFLDDAESLAAALGLAPELAPERLLAAGYRRWGPGLLARMRGDFTLLIWDSQHGEGLLARDQLGVRSTYLANVAGALCFAGELHHLLALLPRRPAPDLVGVAHLIALSGRPGADTIYEGVRRLNPGSLLLLDRSGAREQNYWAPKFTEPEPESLADVATATRASLERAVARRIAPGEGTGVLMSGGLDSATVAALAATRAPGRVSAYAGVFPDHPAVDESSLIAELRSTFALRGLDAGVRAGGLLATAVQSARIWQAPLIGWGDFWTLPLLQAAASAGVCVMLGGDGGDEVFAPRSYVLADAVGNGHGLRSLSLARELPGAGDRPRRRELAKVLGTLGVAGAVPYGAHTWLERLLGTRVPPWLRTQTTRALLDSDDPYAWKRLDGPRWWAHAAHGLTRGVEEVGIFEHHRRRAASAGLEARHPLFDLDLLELALRQPPELTLDRHRNRPVLRESMKGLLPEDVRMRPAKAWFDSLIVDCLHREDLGAVRSLIAAPNSELGAYVDVAKLKRTMFEDASPSFEWMHQLWRLVSVECWLRLQRDPSRPLGIEATEASVSLRQA